MYKVSCLLFVAVLSISWAVANAPEGAVEYEEYGLEHGVQSPERPVRKVHTGRLDEVLLIPESSADVVGMYDPFDGTYMGNLIVEDTLLFDFSTPINAVPGPDFNIYVSDQVEDAVYVFDTTGVFLYTYADSSDGLNNIRGIDFRDGHLFVTSGDDYVREFSDSHTVVRDFIADGSDPFDILFLDDGRSLLCDIQGTTDNVRLYDTSGTLVNQIFSVNFPEQVQFDALLPGEFLNASFSDHIITDFELNGTIISTLPHSSGRGVYRLGNGNLLATNSSGVFELDAVTGAVLQQENSGSARFIELYSPPTGIRENTYRVGTQLLLEAKPNPFAQRVEVRLTVLTPGRIDVSIYNVGGVRIATLEKNHVLAGEYEFVWDGLSDKGISVPEGVYFLKVQTPDRTLNKKLIYLK
jgi:hypothetical protein